MGEIFKQILNGGYTASIPAAYEDAPLPSITVWNFYNTD